MNKNSDRAYYKTPVFNVKNDKTQFKTYPQTSKIPKQSKPRSPPPSYPKNPLNQIPGFWGVLKEGLGLGIGVNTANQVIGRSFDYIFGPRSISIEEKSEKRKDCKSLEDEYQDCINKNLNKNKGDECNNILEEWVFCK